MASCNGSLVETETDEGLRLTCDKCGHDGFIPKQEKPTKRLTLSDSLTIAVEALEHYANKNDTWESSSDYPDHRGQYLGVGADDNYCDGHDIATEALAKIRGEK